MKLLIVINPISGGIKKENIIKKIDGFCEEHNCKNAFYKTTGDSDVSKINQELANKNYDVVVAAGGDGTVNMTAETAIRSNIPLGIIPLGSANGIATELGIPGNINQALEQILQGKRKKIDVLQINSKISIHISDFGLNANVIYRFEKDKSRGFLAYIRHYLLEMFTIKGSHYIIETDKEKRKLKATMLLIANSSKFGTGIRINPEGRIDDGLFEIIVIRSYKTRELIRKFIKFIKGHIDHFELIERTQTRKAIIYNHDGKILQIDGELSGKPEKINVSSKHKVLTVIS